MTSYNVIIDGRKAFTTLKQLDSILLFNVSQDIKYTSVDGAIKIMKTYHNMIIDFCKQEREKVKGPKKASFSRRINESLKSIKNWGEKRSLSKEQIEAAFYNTILRAENYCIKVKGGM